HWLAALRCPSEPPPPESYAEDRLDQRGALVAGEMAVRTQGAIDLPLRRRSLQHARDRLRREVGAQSLPGNRAHDSHHSEQRARPVVPPGPTVTTIARVEDPKQLLEEG